MTLTLRQQVMHNAYKCCNEVDIRLFMSEHFLQRLNLRANNNEAFFNFQKAIAFMIARRDEFNGLNAAGKKTVVCVNIDNDYFFLTIDKPGVGADPERPWARQGQLTCMTYYINHEEQLRNAFADRKFTLKRAQKDATLQAQSARDHSQVSLRQRREDHPNPQAGR